MRPVHPWDLSLVIAVLVASCAGSTTGTEAAWRSATSGSFVVSYQASDAALANTVLQEAVVTPTVIEMFFGESIDRGYRVRIFPDGASLTAYWRSAWSQPGFERQCWMVAAASAQEVQLLSPRVWGRDACGHDAGNATELTAIVRHEAVHVFHRRVNPAPASLNRVEISWFVEGIATLASSQFSVADMASVQSQIIGGYTPASFAELLSGRLGYAGAAALVRYIDGRFGRAAVRAMMRDTSVEAILQRTGRNEAQLLSDWIAAVRQG